MTNEDALTRLGESTAEAVFGVLATFAPNAVERGTSYVIPKGATPFQSVPLPAVASSVSYVDGVTGGNVFVMTRLGARRLASLMMGQPAEELEDDELTELELSAVGEAMNQMMAAAAAATSSVLGEEIRIGPPQTQFFTRPGEAVQAFELTPWAVTVSFTIAGEPSRLVQLVPNAFVVRMTRAFDDLEAEAPSTHSGDGPSLSAESLRQVTVRVSAELGRTRMPIGRAVELVGAVVELDRAVDDPVEVLVNGKLFATGRLVVADGSEWAVRLERILASPDLNAIENGKE